MKSILIATIGLLFFAFTTKDKLTGTWVRLRNTSTTYEVTFNTDNTFNMLVNGKPGMVGNYELRDSIIKINDSHCPEGTGTYHITFFGNDDSCRLQLISDPCTARQMQADGAVLVRINKFKI